MRWRVPPRAGLALARRASRRVEVVLTLPDRPARPFRAADERGDFRDVPVRGDRRQFQNAGERELARAVVGVLRNGPGITSRSGEQAEGAWGRAQRVPSSGRPGELGARCAPPLAPATTTNQETILRGMALLHVTLDFT